jgi:hypothetical protein
LLLAPVFKWGLSNTRLREIESVARPQPAENEREAMACDGSPALSDIHADLEEVPRPRIPPRPGRERGIRRDGVVGAKPANEFDARRRCLPAHSGSTGGCAMSTPSSSLNTLGKSYEVRGNGTEGSQWRYKPLYGWITHLPAGWIFTPAPGIPYPSDGRFYSGFEDAFPSWTGGLVGTWSDEVFARSCAAPARATATTFFERQPEITAPSQAALDDVAAGQLWEARKTLAGFRSQKDRGAA